MTVIKNFISVIFDVNIVKYHTMSHTLWVKSVKQTKQMSTIRNWHSVDNWVAYCESVDQTRPTLETADATAPNAPTTNSPFSRIVGGRGIPLLKEEAIGRPVITQPEH